MPTILNFGMPRSGTTYISSVFAKIGVEYIPTTFMPTTQRHNKDKRDKTFDEIEFRLSKLNNNQWHGLKIGEGTIFHPAKTIFNPATFDFLVVLYPNPVYIIRTYRSAIKNWKSIKYISYPGLALKETGAAMIAEHAGYLSVKSRHNVASIDFDKVGDIDYLVGKLHFLPDSLLDKCLTLVQATYDIPKRAVRPGILRDRAEVHITSKERKYLEKIDKIREIK